jgi:hypothetical protein
MTVVYKCPNTFGEVAGPHLVKGWKPPPVPHVQAAASSTPVATAPVKKKKSYKKRKKRKRR